MSKRSTRDFSPAGESEAFVRGGGSQASRVAILVLGTHHSGAGAFARVLSLLGAARPERMLRANQTNTEGDGEPERLIRLHDRMLTEAGSRWDDWRGFDPTVLGPERLEYYRDAIRSVITEEYHDARFAVLQDPRICRFVPLHEEVLAELDIEPRFLLSYRNPLAVIESLAACDRMTEGFAGLLWLRHELDAERATRGKPRAFLSYEALLGDWRITIERVTEALRVNWPHELEDVADEIDAHLVHDRRCHPRSFADLEMNRGIADWIQESYTALQKLARPGEESEEALATLDRIRDELEKAAPIFGAATFPELAARERIHAVEKATLGHEIVTLQHQLDYITNSKSWRLTAPLRATLLGLGAVKKFAVDRLGLAGGKRGNRAPSARRAGPTKQLGSIDELPGIDPGSAHAAALQVTAEQITRARASVESTDVGRFSIIMVARNHRRTVSRAIESVLAQSYENWELIICDDGSTDGTMEYVRERFARELTSGQVRYLDLKHRGVSAACNAGLRTAHGRWISYLDAGNTWHPHYLLTTAAGYVANRHRRTAYACAHVHDEPARREYIPYQPFDRRRLLARNFVDLNVFSHHRRLYEQLGGFDESLTRLADWDLILRYTRLYEPLFSPLILCNSYVSDRLDSATLCESAEVDEMVIRRRFATDCARSGASLRLAYVLWDWPALSQTFVLEELRELRRRAIDVRVYYSIPPDRAATNIPDVVARRVADAEELARVLVEDERNWIHSHFVSPAVTGLAWPAAERAGIAFSFMPHAVDIFHHANRERNRIGEVASSTLCARVMVYGDHHRHFLIERGVPAAKIIMTPQAVDTEPIRAEDIVVRARASGEPLRVLSIGRFIEKKGIEYLIEAAALLGRGSVEIRIYGYGPLEERFRDLIEQHALEGAVNLHGAFEGADALRAALAWADLFCLPCVEAENGDMDGMPTVFFEAMAAGVPCVAGKVSAIPDFIHDGITGFLVPPRDASALAVILRRVAELPADTLAAIARAARDWTDEHLGSSHTVDTLLDTCANPPLDIFMVTYHRDGHGAWSATERAIRSVLDRTTTPFVLTLVDNGSEESFLERLRELARGDRRICIIEMSENFQCGPASNIALRLARSELVFYVCSNEGYAACTGWERPCLRYMRNRTHVAIGGRLVSSPAWPDGRGYMRQSWFADFRNPGFARRNPDRELFHVQGGLWVLRREVFEAEGGFSDRRPQAQTDVEYSYFLESCGYALGDIPGVLVLSTKTRPGIDAFLDETVVAAHPVFDDDLKLVEACTNGAVSRCNVCGWRGSARRGADGVTFDCPRCGSTPRDRASFRWLAATNMHHRGLALDAHELGDAVSARLQSMFRLSTDAAQIELPDRIPGAPSRMLGIPPQALALPQT